MRILYQGFLKIDDKNVVSRVCLRSRFSFYILHEYFTFLFVSHSDEKKKEIGKIQKTNSAPLITAIGRTRVGKYPITEYHVREREKGGGRGGEMKGKKWMYLSCATVPRSTDKFVVPSCCGPAASDLRSSAIQRRCTIADAVMYRTDELTMDAAIG